METVILETYQPGVHAWIRDEEQGWLSILIDKCEPAGTGQIKIKYKLQGSNDTSEQIFPSSLDELPPLKNPSVLEAVDDLTQLSYLHEPAVLNTIRIRYHQQMIYTYSGIVLIAINPFAKLPLYTPAMVHAYRGKTRDSMEPHVFMVAEESWTQMKQMQSDQSIIVSGESGAGKTVSAKYIMRYLTAVAHRNETVGSPLGVLSHHHHQQLQRQDSSEWETTPVEEQVLATNPILEAFGNAKTTRNNNSSRFGKYIQIQFSDGSEIVGACIRTYLLERSRVVFQPETERNYHIFYQLCMGAPSAERTELGLLSPADFVYLNPSLASEITAESSQKQKSLIPSLSSSLENLIQNDEFDGNYFWSIPNVDDKQDFQQTCKALSLIGLSFSYQWSVFRVLAAILHCGNVAFRTTSDGCSIATDDEYLLKLTNLLGISNAKLVECFVKKSVKMRNEVIHSPRTTQQGMAVRDALAKFLYNSLFTWLVQKVNACLESSKKNVKRFIGVLDIYGFEHFKKNSFEQFCINYANEKLQQEFTQHVFKLEQEEYLKENIQWDLIDYQDNRLCIDLIEGKLGIMDLLDEESRLPAGKDSSFAQKMYKQFDGESKKNDFFSKPRFSQTGFVIHHYAYAVEYTTDGFLDKNRDTVPDEMFDLLQRSSNDFCQELFPVGETTNKVAENDTKSSRKSNKLTLGSSFKQSLDLLMTTVRSTNVHYIRCIKPNEQNVAFEIDNIYVLQQLRACGVLETIRMSCAGYPGRWGHREFIDRYRLLVIKKSASTTDTKQLCRTILGDILSDSKLYQIGLTKVFLKAGQLAFLERRRIETMNKAAKMIQKNIRRWLTQKHYIALCQATLTIQAYVRGWKARREANYLRTTRASLIIQKHWRRKCAQNDYRVIRGGFIQLQARMRGSLVRRQYLKMRQDRAATLIQRHVRRFIAHKRYHEQRKSIITVQSCFRRRQARQELRKLRMEARSVSHFQAKTGALENKVFELTQSLTTKEQEIQALRRSLETANSSLVALKTKEEKASRARHTFEESAGEKMCQLETKLSQYEKEKNQWKSKYEEAEETICEREKIIALLRQEISDMQKTLDESSKRTDIDKDSDRMRLLMQENAQLKEKIAKAFGGKSRLSIGQSANERERPADSNSPSFQSKDAKSGRRLSYDSSVPPATAQEQEVEVPGLIGVTVTSSLLSNPTVDPDSLIRLLLSPALDREIFELLWSRETVMFIKENPSDPATVLYPAHVFGTVLITCLQLRLGDRVRGLLSHLLKHLPRLLNLRDNHCTIICMSNIFELSQIIHEIQDEHFSNRHRVIGTAETERTLAKYKGDLEHLLVDVYYQWTAQIRHEVEELTIQAVVEFQGLPGYIDSISHGFFGKIMGSSSSPKPQVSIEKLINWLTTLQQLTIEYHLEEMVRRQLFVSLIRHIGTISFNYLLARKNLCTWKRGMQIQYNATCIEEWCMAHEIGEAALHLEPLMQATKLLQLNKKSAEDIELMTDVCFLLTPTQMKRFLVMYQPAEFESPVSAELMSALGERCLEDKDQTLYIEVDDAGFVWPTHRSISSLSRFLPATANAEMINIREILSYK